MNCANHSDQAAVAFCRTCGKPLCNQCTRDVRGVIYCESCLAARMEGTQSAPGYIPPQPGYAPPAGGVVPPQTGYQQFMDQGLGLKVGPGPASGPNPAVAGILAGFFPFGVGAVYCSQYAKGLAHLVIMVLLIIGVSSDVPWYVHMVLGIGIGFFYLYQIIDAVRTAKAIQMGEPAPDPLGLAAMFGTGDPAARGEKTETAKIPIAAVVLIGLGILFLVNTAFDFSLHRYWPLILIGLGVWSFAKQWGLLGGYRPVCVCDRCKTRKLMGPAMLMTLGVLFLLNENTSIDIYKTWPAILLVIGVVKLVQSNASYSGHVGPLPPGAPGYPPNTPPPAGMPGTYQNPAPSTSGATDSNTSSSSEVKNV